ncbi:4Fe-4S binding protein [Methylocapsa palsarum]|uniref:Polyferredoxin n=1 Tax=Methylocapsa palsarum TaxID=1612308 RepID=A0A1I4BXG1_9HYPH|nr:4Fe-4S binding protein [Methylocapsa palsarum]SFK73203.1 Polyferredoxin [Methylocapsa palsarum]
MTIGLTGPETKSEAHGRSATLALIEPPQLSWSARGLAAAGRWLRRNQRLIQRVQWAVVLVYIGLVATPAFLPLPERTAHIWNNLTLFAQFAFWGLWWPFVLLSMIIAGRSWCGLFCPEGALTEMASRHSLGLSVPRWITWKGWPFAAFVLTTVYGQMISVYQYPKPALLILGGSTLGAIAVGFLYGRNKRVWCRYLCPVNGVFGLLAKLAPVHFRVDQDAWSRSRSAGNSGARAINCAPLVPIRTMRGGADCHMCGRCEGFRDAIELAPRSPNHEIIEVAGAVPKPWETMLIVFGLMGVAAGAFQWSGSPWYVAIKQAAAEWLIDRSIMWPLRLQPPWWILTDYPGLNDQMTLLDGAIVLLYIAAVTAIVGAAALICLWAAARSLGPWSPRPFHHLAQSLIPIAACGVFLGLSATTVSLLRAEGLSLANIGLLRGALLGGATLWSAALGWSIAGRYTSDKPRRSAAALFVALAASIGAASSILIFFVW